MARRLTRVNRVLSFMIITRDIGYIWVFGGYRVVIGVPALIRVISYAKFNRVV